MSIERLTFALPVLADRVGLFFCRDRKIQLNEGGAVFPDLAAYHVSAVVGREIICHIGQRITDLNLMLFQKGSNL